MSVRSVVTIGASAGGLEAIRSVLAGVPTEIDAALLVVMHMPPSGGSTLANILDRVGPLPAGPATDGELLEPGRVVVCVPDHHLMVADGRVAVRRAPQENGHRPAVDPLFRTAARYYGAQSVGVVLSGTLSDGTSGLQAIRRAGGIAVVQDPDDALYNGMPTSALKIAGADHVLPAAEIGPLLASLAAGFTADPVRAVPADRLQVVAGETSRPDQVHQAGTPSEFPCPNCGGVLWWQERDHETMYLRCRVGHAWAAEDLLDAQRDKVETALWVALRSLEDRSALHRRLAERAEAQGRTASGARFRREETELLEQVDLLRALLDRRDERGVG
jgi:two-component system, chemotaxis family, protein-glutamate methylesterase/glutaminase